LRNWERIKNQEKSREDIFDGVPTGQPALSLATKYLQRAMKNSKEMPMVETHSDLASLADGEIGQALLAIIRVAVEKGIDPESELRRATLRYAESIDRRVESER